MRKFRFRLPGADQTGLWMLTLGIWFHILSRLIRPEPDAAILMAKIIGIGLVLWGGLRIINHWIDLAHQAEYRRRNGASQEAQGGHDEK